jgi:uncharacterized membrane protein YeaQ/YmgE (transglycosylase-associated protein family)
MNLLVTIIVGGIVGWLASILMKTSKQMGIVANVIIGVVGSSLGSAIAGALGIGSGGAIGTWIVAIAGAALLILILKKIGVLAKL